MKNNPGKPGVNVVPSSAGHITAYRLLEAAGIPAKNLNVVTYESGGKARAAVAGGQVDFTILSAEGSEGIRDMVRPLAIVRDTPPKDWEADRKSVGEGKSVSVGVDLGGRRRTKKKKEETTRETK